MTNQIRSNDMNHDFKRDGYVFLEKFLDLNDMEELKSNVDRFIENITPDMRPEHVFYEDRSNSSSLKQLQQMGEYDSYFGKLLNDSPFRTLATDLLGGSVVSKNMQYFNKPPGIGKPTPPHQDGFYFMLDPCEAVTMWLALEEVDLENGCMRYIPGSHKLGIRPHNRSSTLGFSQEIVDFPNEDEYDREVAFPAKPGDLLAHHASTIHRADGNRSPNRTRKAIGFIYYLQSAKEDAVAHNAYRKRLAQEMRSTGKI